MEQPQPAGVGQSHRYEIKELLHRREDLSTFVVHLTSGAEALHSILADRRLRAEKSYGHQPRVAGDEWNPPAVVCLSETPLSHLWTLCAFIEGRQKNFSPHGVLFGRNWARCRGCNPVLYSDATPGHDWLHPLLDCVYREASESGKIALQKFTRYIEPMGYLPRAAGVLVGT